MSSDIKAVAFDLGGVLLPSPIQFLLDYEKEKGLPEGTMLKTIVNCSAQSAFAQWDRGEITFGDFGWVYSREVSQLIGRDVDLADLPSRLEAELRTLKPIPEMLELVKRLRFAGYKTAILSNNMKMSDGKPITLQPEDLALFDDVVYSCNANVRKPEARIYRLVFGLLDVRAKQTLLLEDLDVNIATAEQLGMKTIKVVSPEQAIADVKTLLGV